MFHHSHTLRWLGVECSKQVSKSTHSILFYDSSLPVLQRLQWKMWTALLKIGFPTPCKWLHGHEHGWKSSRKGPVGKRSASCINLTPSSCAGTVPQDIQVWVILRQCPLRGLPPFELFLGEAVWTGKWPQATCLQQAIGLTWWPATLKLIHFCDALGNGCCSHWI